MIIASYKRQTFLVPIEPQRGRLLPGDLVKHALWPRSLGIIVCIAPEQVGVVWSRTDEARQALDDELDRIRRRL